MAPAAQAVAAPSHCGMPMEWKAPAPATMSVYSFAPADAAAELEQRAGAGEVLVEAALAGERCHV